MIVMIGKRLAAAGILAAAMAAAATLWSAAAALPRHVGAPRAVISSALPAVRHAPLTVSGTGASLRLPLATRPARAVASPTVATVTASAALIALALLAVAGPRRARGAAVPVRPPRRGRAPPRPAADHRSARTRHL